VAGFNLFDVGGCHCDRDCLPCPLPAAGLTLTSVVAGAGYTTPLAYTPGAFDTWAGCVPASLGGGSPSFRFELRCQGGACTCVNIYTYTGAGCTGTGSPAYHWSTTPPGGSCLGVDPVGGGDSLVVPSATCSPLSVTWAVGVIPTWTFTIAPAAAASDAAPGPSIAAGRPPARVDYGAAPAGPCGGCPPPPPC